MRHPLCFFGSHQWRYLGVRHYGQAVDSPSGDLVTTTTTVSAFQCARCGDTRTRSRTSHRVHRRIRLVSGGIPEAPSVVEIPDGKREE